MKKLTILLFITSQFLLAINVAVANGIYGSESTGYSSYRSYKGYDYKAGTVTACDPQPTKRCDLILDFPELTGNYPVARKDYCWTDLYRKESFDIKEAHRKVLAKIYFPTTGPKRSGYAPYEPLILKELAKSEAVSKLRDYNIKIRTHAILESVSVAKGLFPIIIFSHGLGLNVSCYTYLCENIASYGFIVVAVESPYISGNSSNGCPVEMIDTVSREQISDIYFEDIKFVLEKLKELNLKDDVLRKRLYLNRVGMFGHSLGGLNAIRVCQEISEVCSGVGMDATIDLLCDKKIVKLSNKELLLFQTKINMEEVYASEDDVERYKWYKNNFFAHVRELDKEQHLDFSDISILKTLYADVLHVELSKIKFDGISDVNGVKFNVSLSEDIAKFFISNFQCANTLSNKS